MYMVMLVLDDINQLDNVLEAWVHIGVPGSTIIESSGLFRRQISTIPMRYRFAENLSAEKENITLLSIVEGEANVHQCLSAVEQVVGDLNNPNTGVFCAWPLLMTKGTSSTEAKGESAG